MFGNYKKFGFTLVEILVAIAIIGLLATIVPPLFRQAQPAAEREKFITQLNALMKFAWNNSIETGKVHRITFFLDKKRVAVAIDQGKKKKPIPVQRAYSDTWITIPRQLEVKNFYINGKDEFARYGAKGATDPWLFIFPQGLSQSIVINMFDTKDKINGRRNRPIGLVLNPFSAQFEVYNEFKKP